MKHRAVRAVGGALACAGLFASTAASAIVPTCVQTPVQLQAALTAAATDNQPNYIGVVTGTYNFAAPLVVNVTDGYFLTIEGGYAAGCAGLATPVPDNTIIKGVDGTNLRLVT